MFLLWSGEYSYDLFVFLELSAAKKNANDEH